MQKLHGIHGRDVRRCGAELATAQVVMLRADHPTLEVQQNIAETITAGKATAGIYAGGPVTASAFIADLCALGRRILSYGSFEEIAGRTPRDLVDPLSTEAERIPITRRGVTADSSALASSVAATAAWSILQSESIGAAGERLRWLIECWTAKRPVGQRNQHRMGTRYQRHPRGCTTVGVVAVAFSQRPTAIQDSCRSAASLSVCARKRTGSLISRRSCGRRCAYACHVRASALRSCVPPLRSRSCWSARQ